MKKRYWQSFNSINAWSDLREAKGATPPNLASTNLELRPEPLEYKKTF